MVTEEIQSALDSGLDVVLSPGVYHLSRALRIEHPDQVLLGLGLATLVAPDYFPTYPTYPKQEGCVVVAPRVAGVRVAGIMLQAGRTAPQAQGIIGGGGCVVPVVLGILLRRPHELAPRVGQQQQRRRRRRRRARPRRPLNPGCSDVFARVGGVSSRFVCPSVDTTSLRPITKHPLSLTPTHPEYN